MKKILLISALILLVLSFVPLPFFKVTNAYGDDVVTAPTSVSLWRFIQLKTRKTYQGPIYIQLGDHEPIDSSEWSGG